MTSVELHGAGRERERVIIGYGGVGLGGHSLSANRQTFCQDMEGRIGPPADCRLTCVSEMMCEREKASLHLYIDYAFVVRIG